MNSNKGSTAAEPARYPASKSPLIKALRLLGSLLPGNYLKTVVYLNLVDAPRRFLRLALSQFYRYDHVYAVIRECRRAYRGSFSILEFGTSDGYSFTKILYATRYLKMEDRITVHGFDSFEGMPPPVEASDLEQVKGSTWVAGEFKGRYESLQAYCESRYRNFHLHKGFFEDSLRGEVLDIFKTQPPLLIWIDCDYYSSARTAFERLLPYLPNGCVIYFDDLDAFNFGSRFTGEAKLVHEVNAGELGDDVELVLDTNLSLNTRSIYRFIRFRSALRYPAVEEAHRAQRVHHRTNDSPLP
jgi:hypothetical protein